MAMRRRSWTVACALGLMALAGTPAIAQTEDPVETAITRFTTERDALRAAGNLNAETYNALLAGALEGVDTSALTLAQIQRIIAQNLLNPATGKVEGIMERLKALSADRGEEGATAACIRVQAMTRLPAAQRGGSEAVAGVLKDALHHPGLPAAIESGAAAPLAGAIGGLNDNEAFGMCVDDVLKFAMGMDEDTSPKLLTGINSIVQGLRAAEVDEAKVEAVRAHLVEVSAAAIAKAEGNPEFMTAQEVSRLQRQHDLLDGAWGRGQLIGYEAPSISFDWSSDEKVTSLEDLRGSVVVVDFWATWCGPCRSSFPKVAELVERYDGYPVRVIGVTSLQGYHISSDADNRERIDCKDDAQKEYGLMPEFMTEMAMNWDVMFSPTNVFNPQYGVNGIPHVTIIAPDGTVRHNGLHPANPLSHKAELIDAILAEFNLPHPEPVAEPAEAEDGE